MDETEANPRTVSPTGSRLERLEGEFADVVAGDLPDHFWSEELKAHFDDGRHLYHAELGGQVAPGVPK